MHKKNPPCHDAAKVYDKPSDPPDVDHRAPDANVADDGRCITPAHQENDRANSGDACQDGRDGT